MLNDILHIVYKSAEDRRVSTGRWDFRHMPRQDLPKENIDGEAILWATKRLTELPERRKFLVVLSDGAPVDDSTLNENGPTYLADHLEFVVKNIAQAGVISLAAMGIGYRAHAFYSVSSYVEAPDELGASLVALIERLLAQERNA